MNHDAQHQGGTGPSEDELRRLLNAAVDDELGARRPAPAFDPARRPSTGTFRRSVRFGVPLLAAAIIVAIAATGVAVTRHNGSSRPAAPPANSSTTSSPAPERSSLPSTPSTRNTVVTSRNVSSLPAPSTASTTSTSRGSKTVDFGGYGTVRLGMTAGQVAQAQPSLRRGTFGNGCTQYFRQDASGLFNIVLAPPGNTVVGITAPAGWSTTTGIRAGSTGQQVRAAYPGHAIEITHSQAGTVLLVQGASSWLGFPIGSSGTVTGVSVGSHDFVAGYEICVGSQR